MRSVPSLSWLVLTAFLVLGACGPDGGPSQPSPGAGSNRPPTAVIVGSGGCHPSAAGSALGPRSCVVQLHVDVSDPDGDPITLAWSGCASGTGPDTECRIDRPGTYQATVSVRDDHGGVTTATANAEGSNAPPRVQFGSPRPPDPAASHSRYFVNGGQPTDPDGDEDPNALCGRNPAGPPGPQLTFSGPCSGGVAGCGGVGDVFDVDVRTGTGPGMCQVDVAVTDSWGAVGTDRMSFVVAAPAASNRPPTARIIGGGSCHPSAPGTAQGPRPCSVGFRVEASDPDGDPITLAWSGCASGAEPEADCRIDQPGVFEAVVTVRDGRGGVTTASANAEGVNAPPEIRFGFPRPPDPAASNTLYFVNGGQPTDPDGDEDSNALCGRYASGPPGPQLTFSGPCSGGVAGCGGVGDVFDVDVRTGTGPGTCRVDVTVTDSWGAVGRDRMSFSIAPP